MFSLHVWMDSSDLPSLGKGVAEGTDEPSMTAPSTRLRIDRMG
jgi:hypothetical protein